MEGVRGDRGGPKGERTFVMLKPEAAAMGLVGRVVARIEDRGLRIAAMKVLRLTMPEAQRLYEMHWGKAFFEELIEHVTSGPVVVMVVEGVGAVKALRSLSGATDPKEAGAGTIRGDYGLTVTKNVIHAADSPENAVREIAILFRPEEIANF